MKKTEPELKAKVRVNKVNKQDKVDIEKEEKKVKPLKATKPLKAQVVVKPVEVKPIVEETEPKQAKTKTKVFMGLGRRKRSVARVWLYDEKGDITVNGKPIMEFFTSESDKMLWQKPFHTVGVSHPIAKFSGSIKVQGGGKTGFIGAVVLGISRALLVYNEEFRSKLRLAGLLTRDSREVESKKVFLKKARKAPQYSKR